MQFWENATRETLLSSAVMQIYIFFSLLHSEQLTEQFGENATRGTLQPSW